jgi:glutamate racemase
MGREKESASGLRQVVTMVDCFRAMVQKEAAQFTHKRILIIGTAFTASQLIYPDLLTGNIPSVKVSTVAATALEGSIARLKEPTEITASLLTNELQTALQHTDIALLACTCFPMVQEELKSIFPKVLFIDPGIYCPDLLHASDGKQKRDLQLLITGSVVSPAAVQHFATNYLCVDAVLNVVAP